MAHTPGQWRVDSEGGMLPCVTGGGGIIYQSARTHGIQDNATIEANARLIAAAPELLDAMKVILAGFEKGIFVRDISHDEDPMWLLGMAVQIAALAKGQRAVDKAEGR